MFRKLMKIFLTHNFFQLTNGINRSVLLISLPGYLKDLGYNNIN